MSVHREILNVEELQGLDVDEPVVMLNLMKFREKSLDGHGSGWDAYQRYSRAVIDLLKANRGTILWAGPVVASALGNRLMGPGIMCRSFCTHAHRRLST